MIMKILLRASNLFLFLMQISVHFDVRILHSRLRGSLLTQINRKIVIRLHWRAADLDVVSLAQPDGCCWSANFQSAKRHPSYALHTPTAVIQCVIVSKGHSFEPVPFRNINANNLEKSRWRTTKINVSVSSVMHRTGFYTSAVSTCKSFDTHHTHEPALREECTLSRVAILAHTRLNVCVPHCAIAGANFV